MIVLIDNYDSFTYNLVQYCKELSATVQVLRNDACSAQAVIEMAPTHILVSPGPGRPEQAGICLPLIGLAAQHQIPLLGVCLGHQAIGAYFHTQVIHAPTLMHGKTSTITHDGQGVYQNLPSPFTVARYHSLVLDRATLPPALIVTSQTDDGVIMGVRHSELPIEGVQFHPESILSEHGHALLKNFLDLPQGPRPAF